MTVDADAEARLLEAGDGGPHGAAARYYELAIRADEKGDDEAAAHAAAALAELCLGGYDGVPKDPARALDLLETRKLLSPLGAKKNARPPPPVLLLLLLFDDPTEGLLSFS